jgi:hypothetical protein
MPESANIGDFWNGRRPRTANSQAFEFKTNSERLGR